MKLRPREVSSKSRLSPPMTCADQPGQGAQDPWAGIRHQNQKAFLIIRARRWWNHLPLWEFGLREYKWVSRWFLVNLWEKIQHVGFSSSWGQWPRTSLNPNVETFVLLAAKHFGVRCLLDQLQTVVLNNFCYPHNNTLPFLVTSTSSISGCALPSWNLTLPLN